MNSLRRLRWLALGVVFVLAGCGKTPETTEKARGVLEGPNIVLAMTVLVIVLAVGLLGAILALDRFVRTRKALAEEPAPEVEEEPEDEVVAGITVGRAPVPRWLYGAYVLIPIFALAYVTSNVAVAPATTPAPERTPEGPCTECTIEAEQIQFTKDTLTVPAGEQITVTFDNTDSAPHTFTVYETEADYTASPDDPIADTGNLAAGAEGDVEFEAPEAGGSYFFICIVHPPMTGTIEAA